MTLTEFRATGKDVSDAAKFPHLAAQELTGAGRAYLDYGLFIEGADGIYALTIGNRSMAGDLAALEWELYTWAMSEGYINSAV